MRRRPPRVLFRAAAGSSQGFGHLVRCRTLAKALHVRPIVSLRGTARSAAMARRLGWRLWTEAPRAMTSAKFDLLVVDDPSARAARPWVAAARNCGMPVATVSDAIDDAILDPAIASMRRHPRRRPARTVLVTLGGGRHVRRRGRAIAAAILATAPGTRVRIAQGFGRRPSRPAPAGARWFAAPHGLVGPLSTATVAVVAGGITLYEACALGTPTVVMPVVAAQRAAAVACARAGAVRYADHRNPARAVTQAAALAVSLLGAPSVRQDLSRRAAVLVDGRGAARVAQRLRVVLAARHPRETRHAA
jgi:spore coat polysaccharide biosynthesis predicted glycosyltransferase SpsG